MILKVNIIEDKYDLFSFIILMIVNVLLQLIIILKLPKYSLVLLIGYNILLSVIIVYKSYIHNYIALLLIANFIPLLYLNNGFHYAFNYELLSATPLFLIIILAAFQYLLSESSFTFKLSYLQKPVIYIVIYFTIIGAVNIYNGQDSSWVIRQLFHIYLYLLIFPLSYLIDKKKYYFTIFSALLLIATIISFEYILLNQVILNFRFVTFQSSFLPVLSGILFSFILFEKETLRRIGGTILLLIITAGAFVTLTRTLWIVTFLTLVIVWFLYQKSKGKLSFTKVLFSLLVLLIPLIMMKDISKGTQTNPSLKNKAVETRAQSVANPLEDSSFLMRIEFAYYAFQRYLESPVIGKGLGDYLKYKVFKISDKANYYIDNSWLYFLWKGGLIGFLLFAWLYLRFFKSAYFVFTNTTNHVTKYLSLGLFAGILGLCFLAVLSPILIKYKTNVLFALIFAYIEFEKSIIHSSEKIKQI
jgi:hypothetical protein